MMKALALGILSAAFCAAQYKPPSGLITVTAVNSSITATSLGTTAVCALHTDTPDGVHACNNSVTDATAANCPAGTLSAPCTFPTSLTIPANALGSSVSSFSVSLGILVTATVPTSIVEMYLDGTRVYSGTATASLAGSRSLSISCLIAGQASGTSAPVAVNCQAANGAFGTGIFSSNSLGSNTAPAIAINTTIAHVLKISIAYTSATTGNSAWLYGMRFAR